MMGATDPGEATRNESPGLTTAVARGLGTNVFDFLRGTPWLGRPLHPALSYLPIGSWLISAVLDLVGLERGADTAIAVGGLTAMPTMLTGCVDWYRTTGQEREVGFVHMCVNCTGMMLYEQSLKARSAGHRRLGVTLSTVGLATILVGSWIGTDLVVNFGMGISPSAWAWLRRRGTEADQTSPGGFAMNGMCPMCGRMMGGGQQMQTHGGQQPHQPTMSTPEEIRKQIETLQRRLDERETVQRLQNQVQQLEERLRKVEAGTTPPASAEEVGEPGHRRSSPST